MPSALYDAEKDDGALSRAEQLVEPPIARTAHLTMDSSTFAGNFDKRPFYVEHKLQNHPLLELPAIAALSERLPKNLVEWNSGHSGAYGKPNEIRPPTLPCKETILTVGERPAWVLLLQIEHDPQYKRLLDELLDQIKPLSEPSHGSMRQRQGFLFISSREAVTPFHFDPEYNFLLQIRGQKTVYMWEAGNRFVMPAAAIDTYYAGMRSNRDQPYRDDFMASAWKLPLKAGQGVHFPLHAPHWVKTESDVSISLSITFRTRQSQFREMVHGANGYVRRLGITPPAPGTSMLWDVAANVSYRGVRKAGRLAKRIFKRNRGS
jgi:hypothetical protein